MTLFAAASVAVPKLSAAEGGEETTAGTAAGPEPGGGESLTGFIVSDAHFGWIGDSQPLPEEQVKAMEVIMKRFPNLDLFFDTGDAHHDYAYDDARGAWTDIIQGGCGTLPFYFIVGNHENHNSLTVDNKFYDYDSEFRSNVLGSVECQPYYSFDYKGIHIISLPPVMDQSYVSDSEMAWLKLDLDIHKDKTTIIMSHNSLKGTTEYFADPAYRRFTNSEILLALFKEYPNVVAWMHGHNHTYEVVPIAGTVYVSNGRIGGFDPSSSPFRSKFYGSGHLGGIFFRVTRESFEVRCFSATKNQFMDEMPGGKWLSCVLNRPTSFDPAAPCATNYGFGGAPHGQKLWAYHHHAGGERQLYITGADNPVINENHLFKVYAQRENPDWQTKHLSGFSFYPNEENEVKSDTTWEWLDPGVRILKRSNPEDKKAIFAPNATLSQRSYYRCAPGQRYKLTVEMSSSSGGQKATGICRVYEKHFIRLHQALGPTVKLKGGGQRYTWEFAIPTLEDIRTIYSDPGCEDDLMLTVGLEFTNIGADVDLHSFRLTLADAQEGSGTLSPAVTIDGQRFTLAGKLPVGTVKSFAVTQNTSDKSLYKIEAGGNRRLTWIEKRIAPKFQVRNATATYQDGKLAIGPLRNHFSAKEEIVVVPTGPIDLPYVHRIRHINNITITEATPAKKEIGVEIGALWVPNRAEVDILADKAPVKVEPRTPHTFKNGVLTLKVKRYSSFKVIW